MSDRELLKAAARAAGYVIESFIDDGGCWASVAGAPMNSDGEPPIFKWHPRKDDGDALRLAARLSINIEHMRTMGGSYAGVNCWPAGRGDCGVEERGEDIAADMRRAIVRAAAAMAADTGAQDAR